MSGYIPNVADDLKQMMAAVGARDWEDLFTDIPQHLRLNRPIDVPAGKTELETVRDIKELAARNKVFGTVLRGAGAYRHFIPAVVSNMAARNEFVTAYTPYQPEISQGVLQAIFEFQTMICELTGMDAANASAYDGATAAAEAVLMCRQRGRGKAVISECAPPWVIETIRTYVSAAGVDVVLAKSCGGVTDVEALADVIDDSTACVYVQQPNFFGCVEDGSAIAAAARCRGAKLVMGINPIAGALLKTPGECGADIAVGEGQPLGLGLAFGGPYLGFMACKKDHMRKLPGRIVGETTDVSGERAYVLTLQAREQHIRREKATSNICSNQALCALTASVYMAAMGPEGLAQTAKLMFNKAHYLKERLEQAGLAPAFDAPFFHEFVTRCPVNAHALNERLEQEDILGGFVLTDDWENCILWCATELNTKQEIDRAADIVRGFVEGGGR